MGLGLGLGWLGFDGEVGVGDESHESRLTTSSVSSCPV